VVRKHPITSHDLAQNRVIVDRYAQICCRDSKVVSTEVPTVVYIPNKGLRSR
jgi:hypothetical protein